MVRSGGRQSPGSGSEWCGVVPVHRVGHPTGEHDVARHGDRHRARGTYALSEQWILRRRAQRIGSVDGHHHHPRIHRVRGDDTERPWVARNPPHHALRRAARQVTNSTRCPVDLTPARNTTTHDPSGLCLGEVNRSLGRVHHDGKRHPLDGAWRRCRGSDRCTGVSRLAHAGGLGAPHHERDGDQCRSCRAKSGPHWVSLTRLDEAVRPVREGLPCVRWQTPTPERSRRRRAWRCWRRAGRRSCPTRPRRSWTSSPRAP